VFAADDFFRITLSNIVDAIDESKEDNDIVFDNNTEHDDTNTDVELL